MFENKPADDVVALPAVGTYTTVVRPHQLKRGDLFTEPIDMGGHKHRTVRIDAVTHGEILYRGRRAPVLFVSGRDVRSHDPVVYTRTSWDFLDVTRAGTADRTAKNLSPTFVY